MDLGKHSAQGPSGGRHRAIAARPTSRPSGSAGRRRSRAADPVLPPWLAGSATAFLGICTIAVLADRPTDAATAGPRTASAPSAVDMSGAQGTAAAPSASPTGPPGADGPVSRAGGAATAIPATEPTVTAEPPAPAQPIEPTSEEPAARSAWSAPLPGAAASSCFGWRGGSMHQGIDLVAPLGTPILAIGDGTVMAAGPADGFGNWVVIRHDDGSTSVYGHMRYYDVAAGDRVGTGQQIALVGNEGQSTGPHLHMEIKLSGRQVDPDLWLDSQGVELGAH